MDAQAGLRLVYSQTLKVFLRRDPYYGSHLKTLQTTAPPEAYMSECAEFMAIFYTFYVKFHGKNGHNMAVLYSNQCYNKMFYKETALYPNLIVLVLFFSWPPVIFLGLFWG